MKTRRCAGRFRASIRLNVKINSHFKKVLFSTNQTFLQIFGANSIPNMAIKGSTKSQSSRHRELLSERIVISVKIKDRKRSTKPTPQSIQPSLRHCYHKKKKKKKKKADNLPTYLPTYPRHTTVLYTTKPTG